MFLFKKSLGLGTYSTAKKILYLIIKKKKMDALPIQNESSIIEVLADAIEKKLDYFTYQQLSESDKEKFKNYIADQLIKIIDDYQSTSFSIHEDGEMGIPPRINCYFHRGLSYSYYHSYYDESKKTEVCFPEKLFLDSTKLKKIIHLILLDHFPTLINHSNIELDILKDHTQTYSFS